MMHTTLRFNQQDPDYSSRALPCNIELVVASRIAIEIQPTAKS